jgi:hypothetical protein
MQKLNLIKPFTIAGFVFGEAYMLYAVLAPYRTGAAIPSSTLAWKIVASAIFFGPFGAAVGMGIGVLVAALLSRWWR